MSSDHSVLGPCSATGGDHDWREGGVRDSGRYHCACCYGHLNPMQAVRELRELRGRASGVEHVIHGIRIRNLKRVPAAPPDQYTFTFEALRDGEWIAYGPQVYGNWAVAAHITKVPFLPQPRLDEPHLSTDETVSIGWGSLNLVHDYEQMRGGPED